MSGILELIYAEQQKTNSLLEQLIANGGAEPAGDADASKTTTTKGKSTAKGKTTTAVKPNHTKDEVVAAVVAVKDAFGAPAAKAITAKFGLAKIADAIKSKGSKALLQIYHGGRMVDPKLIGGRTPVGPSAVAAPRDGAATLKHIPPEPIRTTA